MKTRTFYFSIFFLALLAGSSWFAIVATKDMLGDLSKNIRQDSPDFFMRNIEYKQMDKAGGIQNQLQAAAINHYAGEDSYIFEKPRLEMADKDKNIWHISSSKGSSKGGADAIHLWDDVTITQQNKAHKGRVAEDINIATSDALIKPDQKLASTDKAITITQGKTAVHAVGAEVNFATSTVKLLSQVQGQYATTHENAIKGK